MATSITAHAGRLFVLAVGDGGDPPNYLTVGGLKTTGLTLNNNPVDVTNVASNGYREWLADGGVQDFAIAADGIFDSQTTGADALWTAARARTAIAARLTSGHGDSFTGQMVVTEFRRTGEVDGAETFALQLRSDGPVTYMAGA